MLLLIMKDCILVALQTDGRTNKKYKKIRYFSDAYSYSTTNAFQLNAMQDFLLPLE